MRHTHQLVLRGIAACFNIQVGTCCYSSIMLDCVILFEEQNHRWDFTESTESCDLIIDEPNQLTKNDCQDLEDLKWKFQYLKNVYLVPGGRYLVAARRCSITSGDSDIGLIVTSSGSQKLYSALQTTTPFLIFLTTEEVDRYQMILTTIALIVVGAYYHR